MIRYNYICIEGNIGAGKTTLATELAGLTGGRLILEEFEENPYLPLFYTNPQKYALHTEMTFLIDRYKQLSSRLIGLSLFEPLTISDYFIIKSKLFSRNNLTDDDFKVYSRIYRLLEANLPKPDLLIYLHQNTETLLLNIKKRGRPYEQNISVEYLVQLQEAYFRYLKNEKRFPVIILKTDDYAFSENKNSLHYITDLLKKEFEPGITII